MLVGGLTDFKLNSKLIVIILVIIALVIIFSLFLGGSGESGDATGRVIASATENEKSDNQPGLEPPKIHPCPDECCNSERYDSKGCNVGKE